MYIHSAIHKAKGCVLLPTGMFFREHSRIPAKGNSGLVISAHPNHVMGMYRKSWEIYRIFIFYGKHWHLSCDISLYGKGGANVHRGLFKLTSSIFVDTTLYFCLFLLHHFSCNQGCQRSWWSYWRLYDIKEDCFNLFLYIAGEGGLSQRA